MNDIGSTESSHRSGSSAHEYVQYPNNLTVLDLYYFMIVPSLCYELNFPRTSRIRKHFLLKRIIEVVVGFQVVFGLIQQWIIPSVKNSLITFSVRFDFSYRFINLFFQLYYCNLILQKMDVLPATERLLKLAVR